LTEREQTTNKPCETNRGENQYEVSQIIKAGINIEINTVKRSNESKLQMKTTTNTKPKQRNKHTQINQTNKRKKRTKTRDDFTNKAPTTNNSSKHTHERHTLDYQRNKNNKTTNPNRLDTIKGQQPQKNQTGQPTETTKQLG
jgi:hypothetical protein